MNAIKNVLVPLQLRGSSKCFLSKRCQGFILSRRFHNNNSLRVIRDRLLELVFIELFNFLLDLNHVPDIQNFFVLSYIKLVSLHFFHIIFQMSNWSGNQSFWVRIFHISYFYLPYLSLQRYLNKKFKYEFMKVL